MLNGFLDKLNIKQFTIDSISLIQLFHFKN